jgi:hypothetical protein
MSTPTDHAVNQTPNTPGMSETRLRARAEREGVADAASMRTEELVEVVSSVHRRR